MGTKITTVINPTFEQNRSFISKIPVIFENEGTLIYNSRNQIKIIIDDNGKKWNVKRFGIPRFYNKLIYTIFRKPKALRAYQNSITLNQLGINTPIGIGYIIEKKHGFLNYSYLITEQSNLSRRFYEFGDGDIHKRKHILKDFARFVAHMHDNHVFHKDLSPGNILFDENDNETQFSLVDINRITFCPVTCQKGCANFARLWGSKAMFLIIAEEYARCRKFNKDECYSAMLKYRYKFWKRFSRRHTIKFELDL